MEMLLSREKLIEDSPQAVNVRALRNLPARLCLLGRHVFDGANNLAFDRNGGIAAVLLSLHLRQPKTARQNALDSGSQTLTPTPAADEPENGLEPPGEHNGGKTWQPSTTEISLLDPVCRIDPNDGCTSSDHGQGTMLMFDHGSLAFGRAVREPGGFRLCEESWRQNGSDKRISTHSGSEVTQRGIIWFNQLIELECSCIHKFLRCPDLSWKRGDPYTASGENLPFRTEIRSRYEFFISMNSK